MIPYLVAWSALALPCLGLAKRIGSVTSIVVVLFLTLFIGLRVEVGADWLNYLPAIERTYGLPWFEILFQPEPAYGLLNWIGANMGGGVFLVNLVCGLIFSIALLVFARAQPRPWLALTLAFPYLILVVAMGYSRQGVAIALELLALLALESDRLFRFLGWIFVASLFHRTALLLLIVPASTLSGQIRLQQLFRLLLLAGAGYGLYLAVIAPDIDYYVQGYIEAQYQSQGALIRVVLCLLPAVAFLPFRKRFGLAPLSRRIWTLFSLLSLACLPALFLVGSSTVVDRLALYLIPLQLFVGSRLPDTRLFGFSVSFWNGLLVAFSLVVLLVWLLYAAHSFAWLPYRNLLFSP